jgi:hypothetical protein
MEPLLLVVPITSAQCYLTKVPQPCPDDCVPGDAVLLVETAEGRYGSTLGEAACPDVRFDVGGDPQVRRKHLAGRLVGHGKGDHARK